MPVTAADIDFYLHTDPLKFDQEVNDFPEHYREVAEAVADARREVDQGKSHLDIAKELLKSTDADLYIRVMASPEKYGLPKATEKSIEAAVATHAEHAEAFKAWVSAKNQLNNKEHACGILEAALSAMDSKKELALKKGVELHLAKYRSTPGAGYGGGMPFSGRKADDA